MEEFYCNVNITEIYQLQDDIEVYYYFDAEYSDDDYSQLWSVNLNGGLPSWHHPFLVYHTPEETALDVKTFFVLKSSNYEEFETIDLEKKGSTIPVCKEDILRFYIGITGDESFEEIYDKYGEVVSPRIILKPLDVNDNRIVDLPMVFERNLDGIDYYFIDFHMSYASYTWEGEPGVLEDKYDVWASQYNVWETDFGSGAWTITFNITDPRNANNEIIQADTKIWHMGSMQSFLSAMNSGPGVTAATINNPVISQIGLYAIVITAIVNLVSAGLAIFPKTQPIARSLILATLITNTVVQFVGLACFLTTEDTGALLGGGLYYMITLGQLVISILAARVVSSFAGSISALFDSPSKLASFAGNFMNTIGKIAIILNLAYIICAALCNPWLFIIAVPVFLNTVLAFSSRNPVWQRLATIGLVAFNLATLFSSLLGLLPAGEAGSKNPFTEENTIFQDPNLGIFEEFIKNGPMVLISILMSGLGLGVGLGFLGVIGEGNTKWVNNALILYATSTLVTSLVYLIAFLVRTQFFLLISGLITDINLFNPPNL